MSAGDLGCQELVELVTDYLEDRLPRGQRRRFERHLLECEGCVTYVEQMRETIRLVGRSAAADPERVPGLELLLDAFRDWKREQLA
jgi:anti-sigma factor RsiW